MDKLINQILESLSDDLLKKKYLKNKKNEYWGHCYVATETLYYLLNDDVRNNFKPATLKIGDITHWFLKNIKTGEIVDPTEKQFNEKLDYSKSRNRFFLTNTPSKRTLILLNRIYEKNCC